jgi:hypothetical protein
MYIAFGSKNQAETAIRQLEERFEQQFTLLRAEVVQYVVTIEDVLDKIDHITKRHRKRRQREDPPPDSEPEVPELDEISARVLERRTNRGVSA